MPSKQQWRLCYASKQAESQMSKLPVNCRRLLFQNLARVAEATNPLIPEGVDVKKVVTLKNVYRIRQNDYRLFFQLDGRAVEVNATLYNGTIVVVGVAHRGDAYRRLS